MMKINKELLELLNSCYSPENFYKLVICIYMFANDGLVLDGIGGMDEVLYDIIPDDKADKIYELLEKEVEKLNNN